MNYTVQDFVKTLLIFLTQMLHRRAMLHFTAVLIDDQTMNMNREEKQEQSTVRAPYQSLN